MISVEQLRALALSFPETTEDAHFENNSFRVKNKIFATYDEKLHRATLKLSEIDQDVFSSSNKQIIYPVPNKWGKHGWTFVEMKDVNKDLFIDAVTTAYCEVAPTKLARLVRPDSC